MKGSHGYLFLPGQKSVRLYVCGYESPDLIFTGFGTFRLRDGKWRWIVDESFILCQTT